MAQITSTGIGSGLDISSIVQQLVEAERAPTENRLDSREIALQSELSAIGSFKSVLSRFKSNLESLQELTQFQKRTATSSNEEIFTATIDSDAVAGIAAGTYEVEVVELARRHKIASTAYADSATSIGTGTLEISVGNDTFSVDIDSVDGGDTVEAIRDAINNAEDNTGVVATIVEDENGSHLVLSAKETGSINEITVNVITDGSDTGTLSDLAFDPNSASNPMQEKVAALDSKVIVDGFTQTSSDLTVEGIIQGITLELVDADPGTKYNLDVELDKNSARNAVTSFVSSYNSLVNTINTLTAYDPDTGVSGTLQGDSTLIRITSMLRQQLTKSIDSVSGDVKSLLDLGVTTDLDTGTLELDSEKLTEAVDKSFDQIGKIFANDDGYAANIISVIEPYLESDGFLETRTKGLESSIDLITDQREALELRMESVQKRYTAQFNALDSLVAQLNSTGSFLSLQLENLPGFTYNND